jgi:hypothetical protein
MTEIQYLNTDLDVRADRNTGPLTEALQARGLSQLNPNEDLGNGQWLAVFETNLAYPKAAPERDVAEMLDAVESLTGEAAAVWAGCSVREFNLGYECGDRPLGFNQGLSNDVLRRLVAVGASLRITLYPVRPSDAPTTDSPAGPTR